MNMTEEQFEKLSFYIMDTINLLTQDIEMVKVNSDAFLKSRNECRKAFGLPEIVDHRNENESVL